MTMTSALHRIRLGSFAVVLLLLLSGCIAKYRHPGLLTKGYLYDAYYAWEDGDKVTALKAIQRALARAAKEKVPGPILIEVYDDAGLYFYVNGERRESVIHQSVAVLLSRKIEVSEHKQRFYVGNLRRAIAGSGLELESDPQATDTDHLLAIPEVRVNPHIRKYYGL